MSVAEARTAGGGGAAEAADSSLRETLTIRPAAAAWRGIIRRNDAAMARRMREQLGLPLDRPVVMTGHQAEFWHPGILAKYLAADAAARAVGGAPAWLVVDQDRAERVTVRYPAREDGRVSIGTIDLARPQTEHSRENRVATVRERAGNGRHAAPPAAPFIADGIASITAAMSRHRTEPALARGVAASLSDLMRPLLGISDPPALFATGLSGTELFAELVEKMRADPEACVRAYNAAAAAHPTAGIRPLVSDEVQYRFELPLWWLPAGRERERVYAEMLDSVPVQELAPKALLMTALMRMAACDVFIHGTGGGGGEHEGYDLVMEDWLAAWLGLPRESLAPMAVVTATMYLPLDVPPRPTGAEVARAVWLAHHARHDPRAIGDGADAERKRAMVAAIAAAPKSERAHLFREMHKFLDAYRQARGEELARLDEEARAAAVRAGEPDVRSDRTWAFPLYPVESLGRLRAWVEAEFGVGPAV